MSEENHVKYCNHSNTEKNKQKRTSREYLGCQIWLEPTDSKNRVEYLFKQAREAGLGWVRIFLMWQWIEEKPQKWNFQVFDYAFEAALNNNIKIKATLTANSGPWHIGTPSMLHSATGFLSHEQREPMKDYITKCVNRYKNHPALGQWILWNEPTNGGDRTSETLTHWRNWLNKKYSNDIESLNNRWLTGYSNFNEVPFPEDVPNPVHKASWWNIYRPWLDDWKSRSEWLISELNWVKDVLRSVDANTETCINPMPFLNNQAEGGIELDGMGKVVDIVGASYHPAWNFRFANRELFPSLMATGLRKQAAHTFVKRVEVTEVQTGNTFNSAFKPCEASAKEIAQFFLACIAAGAESVSGWCLNIRSQDFEAGDWGMLDDNDNPSPRSKMLAFVNERFQKALNITGSWNSYASKSYIAYDPGSQAIEWVEGKDLPQVPGRLIHDGAFGAALLSTVAMQLGISTAITKIDDIPIKPNIGELLILSHLVAWEETSAQKILSFAELGGVVLIDATSGRKTLDASIHRPWPGGIANIIGMRAAGLQSSPVGYEVSLNGLPSGKWLLTRSDIVFDEDCGWSPWEELRFTQDGEPCVWERDFGKGKIIICRGIMGPTLVHNWDTIPSIKHIIEKASSKCRERVYPVIGSPYSFVIPVEVENGSLWAIFAPCKSSKNEQYLTIKAPKGTYKDLWNDNIIKVSSHNEITIPTEDGIILLWTEEKFNKNI